MAGPITLQRPIATFSLVARDPETGDLGVGVASKFLSVGAYVSAAESQAGAVASQSFVNTTFGPRALRMMAEGASPEACADAFRRSDPRIQSRQFGIVSRSGESTTFTGSECHPWAGGRTGPGYAAQGNILTGPEVVDALVDTLLESPAPFPERLLGALRAADEAGGDRRGRQSAALLVVGEGKGYGGLSDRWIDLRVDDHSAPIGELERLLSLHRLYLDKPSQAPHALTPEEIGWLQDVLQQHGYLKTAPTKTWNDETERALEALFGVENLEERWLECRATRPPPVQVLRGAVIDPVALAYLKSQFGTKG